MIETKAGAKTDVAYRLAFILEREYGEKGKRQALKSKLPPYILRALEHLTGPWPENLDAEPDETPAPPAAASVGEAPPETGRIGAAGIRGDS